MLLGKNIHAFRNEKLPGRIDKTMRSRINQMFFHIKFGVTYPKTLKNV